MSTRRIVVSLALCATAGVLVMLASFATANPEPKVGTLPHSEPVSWSPPRSIPRGAFP